MHATANGEGRWAAAAAHTRAFAVLCVVCPRPPHHNTETMCHRYGIITDRFMRVRGKEKGRKGKGRKRRKSREKV